MFLIIKVRTSRAAAWTRDDFSWTIPTSKTSSDNFVPAIAKNNFHILIIFYFLVKLFICFYRETGETPAACCWDGFVFELFEVFLPQMCWF
jgi:hypothetical protein